MPNRKRYEHIRRNLSLSFWPFLLSVFWDSSLSPTNVGANVQQLLRNAYIYKYCISSVNPTCNIYNGDFRDSEKETHKFHVVGKKVRKWLLLAIYTLLTVQTSPTTCAVIILIECVGMIGEVKGERECMFRALMQWETWLTGRNESDVENKGGNGKGHLT